MRSVTHLEVTMSGAELITGARGRSDEMITCDAEPATVAGLSGLAVTRPS